MEVPILEDNLPIKSLQESLNKANDPKEFIIDVKKKEIVELSNIANVSKHNDVLKKDACMNQKNQENSEITSFEKKEIFSNLPQKRTILSQNSQKQINILTDIDSKKTKNTKTKESSEINNSDAVNEFPGFNEEKKDVFDQQNQEKQMIKQKPHESENFDDSDNCDKLIIKSGIPDAYFNERERNGNILLKFTSKQENISNDSPKPSNHQPLNLSSDMINLKYKYNQKKSNQSINIAKDDVNELSENNKNSEFNLKEKKKIDNSFLDHNNDQEKRIEKEKAKESPEKLKKKDEGNEKEKIYKEEINETNENSIQIKNFQNQKCQTSESINILELKKIFKRRRINNKKNEFQFPKKKEIFSDPSLKILNFSIDSQNAAKNNRKPGIVKKFLMDEERKSDDNITKKTNQSYLYDNNFHNKFRIKSKKTGTLKKNTSLETIYLNNEFTNNMNNSDKFPKNFKNDVGLNEKKTDNDNLFQKNQPNKKQKEPSEIKNEINCQHEKEKINENNKEESLAKISSSIFQNINEEQLYYSDFNLSDEELKCYFIFPLSLW